MVKRLKYETNDLSIFLKEPLRVRLVPNEVGRHGGLDARHMTTKASIDSADIFDMKQKEIAGMNIARYQFQLNC